uniref:dTCF n=1 Tax=Panagrolaimus superbus TaxID=310955 RepID=A0A914YZB1_9BILA
MADEGLDEVKVFRKIDTDAVDDEGEDDQLFADKQDVAAEAEIEEETAIQGNSSFQPLGASSAFSAVSPAVPWMGAYLSPAYQMMQNMSLMSPSFYSMMINNPRQLLNQMRPPDSFNQFPSSSTATDPSTGGPIRTPKSSKENRRIIKEEKQKPLIKKPLNAYMIFMKDNRHKVLEEDGNASKQSAEINAILGKRWQQLSEEEQKIYFDKASKEKEEHARKYPGWSARDNYAIHKKKKIIRKIERNNENSESKKCRARYGIDHQDMWCRHCKRKKRCLLVDSEGNASDDSTDSPPTPGSGGDLPDVKPHISTTSASPSLSSTMSAAAQQMQNFMSANMAFPMANPFSFGINGMPTFPFQSLMAFNPAAAAAGMNPQLHQQQPIIHPSSIQRQDDTVLRTSNSNESTTVKSEL